FHVLDGMFSISKTGDLDAYDSDYDDVSNAKAVLMANLSNYGLNVISETLILEEVSRSKMLAKQNDPISKEKKIDTTLINYFELNQLSKDFGIHFVPQQELSVEHAFWLQTLHPNTDQSDISPVKIEAPMELSKDKSCDNQNDLEILEYFKNNDLKAQLQAKYTTIYLNGQIQEKVFVTTTLQNELRRLNGKYVLDNATTITNAITIAPGIFKLDLDPLAPRLSHLNFGTLNQLAKDGLARGIPKLKFKKDHLYSACALGKSKKSSHQPKAEDTNQKKLYLLHMDLCGSMRMKSINDKNISHQTSVARTPQQNGVVERQNRTLVEVARTIEDLGKLNAKSDIGIFVGYAPAKKAFRIYNRRTQKIMETIHITFDELTAMASEQFSSGSELQFMTPATSSSGLSSHTPFEIPGKWTKNHPIANVNGDPSRLVSTRKQLQTDVMWCYFDAFLTLVNRRLIKKQCSNPLGLMQCKKKYMNSRNCKTGSLYPKTHWELLPKDILGATTQRDTESYYPETYWELLPKEILPCWCLYPKIYWELLPKEILGATTQRDTSMLVPLPKDILGATTQRDTGSYYPKI
nr:integrase, catalytic region, zinc finger, CCHC-type, peptidase aspartic, catalytic [Tanacetum cinerariifolium]